MLQLMPWLVYDTQLCICSSSVADRRECLTLQLIERCVFSSPWLVITLHWCHAMMPNDCVSRGHSVLETTKRPWAATACAE